MCVCREFLLANFPSHSVRLTLALSPSCSRMFLPLSFDSPCSQTMRRGMHTCMAKEEETLLVPERAADHPNKNETHH